jgi:hypothetical protein
MPISAIASMAEQSREAHQVAFRVEQRADTHVMTDKSNTYMKLGDRFAKQDSVDHSREEWGYTDRKTGVSINTNTIAGRRPALLASRVVECRAMPRKSPAPHRRSPPCNMSQRS